MNIRYKLCLLLYYGFARHLPKSTVPVIGTAAKRMRGAICRHILGCCGSGNNIEQGAYIGNGKDVRIGNNVGGLAGISRCLCECLLLVIM